MALEKNPADAGLHAELAGVRREHGEWQNALQEWNEVERLAPGKYPIDFLRAQVLYDSRDAAGAIRALDRFIATHPAHPPARLLRGRARAALHQAEASLADFRAAFAATTQLEPDLVIEVAGVMSAQGHREEALAVFLAGIARLGPVPSLLLPLIDLEIASGRADTALARIDAAQKSAPRPEPWMAKRADALGQLGRNAEARVAWENLMQRLAALPPRELGSNAMSQLAVQAREALAAPPAPSLSTTP